MSLFPPRIRRLFVADAGQFAIPTAQRGQPVPAGEPPALAPNAVGSFIAPQSITTFAGATLVVMLLTWACNYMGWAWPHNGRDLTPLIPSVLVGTTVFLVNIDDPSARPNSLGKWMQAVLAGVANTVILFAAATGALEIATSATPIPTEPGPPPAERIVDAQ